MNATSTDQSVSMAPNAYRLLWGGFMAILAAGIGFSIRGGFLDNWGAEFGFTSKEMGDISGMGFNGFCFGIIIGGSSATKSAMENSLSPHFCCTSSRPLSLLPHKSWDKDMAERMLTLGVVYLCDGEWCWKLWLIRWWQHCSFATERTI